MYEIIYIVSPKLEDKEVPAVCTQLEKIVTDKGGKIIQKFDLGKRKIATPINNFRHGSYFIVQFDLESAKISEVEKEIKLIEQIIRYMPISYDKATLDKMKAQKSKVKLLTDPVTENDNVAEKAPEIKKAEVKKPKEEKAKPAKVETQKKLSTADKEKALEMGTAGEEKTEEKSSKPKVNQKELDEKLNEILDDDLI